MQEKKSDDWHGQAMRRSFKLVELLCKASWPYFVLFIIPDVESPESYHLDDSNGNVKRLNLLL